MKRLNQCSKHDFIRLFFALCTLALFVAAVLCPDRDKMFYELKELLTHTCKVPKNTFDCSTFAGAFLNTALVCLACTLLYCLPGAKAGAPSVLGFLLTMGFGFWGITILNMWFGVLGVLLYCLIKKEAPGKHANSMLFSTALSPLYADLMFRYPDLSEHVFSWAGLGYAIAVGVVVGFLIPATLAHSPKTHKGYSLYSAAMTVGIISFFLRGILYTVPGVEIPAGNAAETMKIASLSICNIFCIAFFAICVIVSLLMGTKPKDYWNLMKHSGHGVDYIDAFGNGTFLMNVGVYGLFIMAYYNLIGTNFNAVALGCVFCMLAGCCSGSHPRNVWPCMLGYAIASYGMKLLIGADYAFVLNNQTIVIGLCFCSALSPIAGTYGWFWGAIASILHYFLVRCVPDLHGGFLLYNGGFTACLVCVMFIPVLEHFCKTKAEKKALKEGKTESAT